MPESSRHVAVVGLGFVGSTTARYLAGAGMAVHGYDRSETAVHTARDLLARKLGAEAFWEVGTDPRPVGNAEAVFVAVRLVRDQMGHFGTEPLEGVAAMLRRYGSDGQIVLVESTVPPGTTRRFTSWLDRPGIDVAHAPERLRVGDGDAALRSVPRLVGGMTARATERGCALLEEAGLSPVPVNAPEVSELAKLLENAFLTTNIALVGEMTKLALAVGVSAHEVTVAAASKPHGFMAFHPGAGIGGHCLRNDLDLLRQAGMGLGLETPMLDGIAKVASSLPGLVVERLQDCCNLAGAHILLIGVGFKSGSADLTETAAKPVCRLLRGAGCSVSYLDRLVPEFVVDGEAVPRLTPAQLRDGGLDALVVLSGDDGVTMEELRASGASLLDAGGGSTMSGAWRADERL
jgi:UDP-N-acetyl-D-glucosamine dehydrogenase